MESFRIVFESCTPVTHNVQRWIAHLNGNRIEIDLLTSFDVGMGPEVAYDLCISKLQPTEADVIIYGNLFFHMETHSFFSAFNLLAKLPRVSLADEVFLSLTRASAPVAPPASKKRARRHDGNP